MRTTLVKLHSFADAHHRSGKVEAEHVVLAIAYAMAAIFHFEFALAIAYCVACGCTYFARA